MSSSVAAAYDRSMSRLSTNGPRSLTFTTTRLPFVEIRDLDPGRQRQRRVRGRHRVHVVGLAARGREPVEIAAVPRRDAALRHSRRSSAARDSACRARRRTADCRVATRRRGPSAPGAARGLARRGAEAAARYRRRRPASPINSSAAHVRSGRVAAAHHSAPAPGVARDGLEVAAANRLAQLMRRERVLRAAVVARDDVEVVVADPVLRAAALGLERVRRGRRVRRQRRREHVAHARPTSRPCRRDRGCCGAPGPRNARAASPAP